jgi:hypothetical protein
MIEVHLFRYIRAIGVVKGTYKFTENPVFSVQASKATKILIDSSQQSFTQACIDRLREVKDLSDCQRGKRSFQSVWILKTVKAGNGRHTR